MNYNPVYLNDATQSWTGVDTRLSGGNTNRAFIYSIAYSGSRLFFGGSFIFNYTNIPWKYNYVYPISSYSSNYINVGYFDDQPTMNIIKSLKNIGTRVEIVADSAASTYDGVFNLALCANNLVAAGRFNLVNTEITGFQTTTHINRSLFYQLSDTWPFNTTLPPLTTIKTYDWAKLYNYIGTQGLPASGCFTPSFSGDYAKNITYYDNNLNKWVAFPDTANIINNSSGQLNALGVIDSPLNSNSKMLFTAGTHLSGTLLYYTGTRWDFIRPSLSSSRHWNANPQCYQLYNDNRGNLIYVGSFSGLNGDWKRSGVAKYNGTFTTDSLIALGTGLTGASGHGYCVTMSGDNYIVGGLFDSKIAYFDINSSTNWKKLYSNTNNSIFLSSSMSFNSIDLDINNNKIYLAGDFYFIKDDFDMTRVAQLTSDGTNYSFGRIDGNTTVPDIETFNRNIPQILFVNRVANYTIDSTLSSDFNNIAGLNLRTHLQNFDSGGQGISIYGKSPYQGVSGLSVN